MRRSVLRCLLLLPLVPLAGCASYATANDAPGLQRGPNTITGHAQLFYSASGYVRDCDGEDVYLVPVTPDSSTRMTSAFGSPAGGYVSGRRLEDLLSATDRALVRSVECTDGGQFRFTAIPDGQYFVLGRILWLIGHGQNMANLMSMVSVTNGETIDVELKKVF